MRMRMGWWCWQGRECTAPEFTAPVLCPQEMRSARRPTSGLSSTQVSSTTRFHRAPGLGRQASPSLTPYGWEEAAGRPAGRPDAQCCCTVSCRGLPRTRHWLPFPTSGEAGAGGTDTCTSQPGAATPTTGQKMVATSPWAVAHGYGLGGSAPLTTPFLPFQLHPNSHSPLQPWFPHPTAHPLSWPQGPPSTQGPRSPWSPRDGAGVPAHSAAQGWLLPPLSVVILFPL